MTETTLLALAIAGGALVILALGLLVAAWQVHSRRGRPERRSVDFVRIGLAPDRSRGHTPNVPTSPRTLLDSLPKPAPVKLPPAPAGCHWVFVGGRWQLDVVGR